MTKPEALIEDFASATDRLREVLNEKKSTLIRDAAIKRFELVFDLSWKTVKTFLEERKGIVCHSPADCFREAYQNKLISFDDFWLELVKTRNLTVHTYNEKLAEQIYGGLPKALQKFEELLAYLKENES